MSVPMLNKQYNFSYNNDNINKSISDSNSTVVVVLKIVIVVAVVMVVVVVVVCSSDDGGGIGCRITEDLHKLQSILY